MKKINYYVIGGQYEGYNYGGAATLLEAKRLARRNQEYWDNWQGWHTPNVYAASDCEWRTTLYGRRMILPMVNAQPVTVYNEDAGRWDV